MTHLALPPINSQGTKLGMDSCAAFLVIFDLSERTGVPIVEITGWLKSGQPKFTEIPSAVAYTISLLSGQ